MPIGALIGSFVWGAIMFVIWKIMGSNEEFETAYRCTAYSMAIGPIAILAGLIPFVGWLAGMVWGLYLVVTASVEVHKILAKTAWMVFGIITGVFVLMGGCTSLMARRAASGMQAYSQEMQKAAKEMEKSNADMGASAAKSAAAMSKILEAQAKQMQLQAEKAAKEAQAEADKAAKEQ